MKKEYIIIGLGHRARNGKDTVAQYVKDMRSNTHILHFADALYEEVTNRKREYPLITRTTTTGEPIYNLLIDSSRGIYQSFYLYDVPFLDKIFDERNIYMYWGMDEKDAPMLQFWGTNFRRKQYPNYWVSRLDDKIRQITLYSSATPIYICISDVRFLNEVNYIERLSDDITSNKSSVYIKVVRMNEDGTQYIDPSRDPNHPSETELENHKPFMTLTAKGGDLLTLRKQTVEMLNIIEETYQ